MEGKGYFTAMIVVLGFIDIIILLGFSAMMIWDFFISGLKYIYL